MVANAIPVFTPQLVKSHEATDVANVRSAYAALMADFIANGSASTATVTAQQKEASWQGPGGSITTQINGTESHVEIPAKTDSYIITINARGLLTIN